MSNADPRQNRTAQLETLEARIVLSAQPVSDFALDDFMTQQIERALDDVTTYVSNGDNFTGLSQVIDDYGLTGEGQTVAVIDTGIAWDHYALGGGFGAGHQVVGGWDFAENDANPYDDGPAGFHGTHVAGIIGSNDANYSGVAPGSDLVALRVFDDMGNATFDWVEQALQWVHDHQNDFENPITTVNLSLGANWNADTVPNWAMLEDEFAQLKEDGIFISVAAGNSFANYGTAGLSYPAASPLVVPIASVGDDGELSDFSQRNQRVVAAPGESIQSTVPGHIFGSTTSNQFMALSGTSMAAPYMAGASVLLREAMMSAGWKDIDQDVLYEHFRATADEIWDSTTQANYLRVNIANAIQNVLGNDVGDSIGNAQDLGTISNQSQFDGLINSSSDVDVYAFKAQHSGTLTWNVEGDAGLQAKARVMNETSWQTDGTVTLHVNAGETYYLAVGSQSGSGAFTASADFVADYSQTTENWGTLRYTEATDQSVNEEWGAKFKASRSGRFTFIANFDRGQGDLDYTLFDRNGNQLATSREFDGGERIDFDVEKGTTYYLKATGTNSSAEIRAANLLTVRSNGNIVVFGTANSERYDVQFQDRLVVGVNGIRYRFDYSQVQNVSLRAASGEDSIRIEGDASKEIVRVKGTTLVWNNAKVNIRGYNLEQMQLDAGEGQDRAFLLGSQGQDELTASKMQTTFSGDGYQHQLEGITFLKSTANGAQDIANLVDSSGNDRFVAKPQRSVMTGSGYRIIVAGYSQVDAIQQNGGFDVAFLNGGKSDDQFSASANKTQVDTGSIAISVSAFDRVKIFGRGGDDSFTGTSHLQSANWIEQSARDVIRGNGYEYIVVGVNDKSVSNFASLNSLSFDGQFGSVGESAGWERTTPEALNLLFDGSLHRNQNHLASDNQLENETSSISATELHRHANANTQLFRTEMEPSVTQSNGALEGYDQVFETDADFNWREIGQPREYGTSEEKVDAEVVQMSMRLNTIESEFDRLDQLFESLVELDEPSQAQDSNVHEDESSNAEHRSDDEA